MSYYLFGSMRLAFARVAHNNNNNNNNNSMKDPKDNNIVIDEWFDYKGKNNAKILNFNWDTNWRYTCKLLCEISLHAKIKSEFLLQELSRQFLALGMILITNWIIMLGIKD